MATTNEEMYTKDWQESIPQMTTEELVMVLSKEEDYNPQYVEIVKEEYAKRPQVEAIVSNVQMEKTYDESLDDQNNQNAIPRMLFVIIALIGLAGVGSLRNWDVPFFILCMYCVWLFIKKKENAVSVAKSILVISLLSTIVSFFLRDSEYQMGGWLLITITRISLILGCLYYLHNSEDVDTFIPREIQYMKNRDYFLIGLSILFYIVMIFRG